MMIMTMLAYNHQHHHRQQRHSRVLLKSFLLCILIQNAVIFAGAAEASVNDDAEKSKSPLSKPHFTPPKSYPNAFLVTYFDGPSNLNDHFVLTKSAKHGNTDSALRKYDGEWRVEVPASAAQIDDYALVLASKARHAAISRRLENPVHFNELSQLVVQYEVKFQNGHECGGAYVKLLSDQPKLDLTKVNDNTGYTIMFGPDRCGMDSKIHFIIRYKHKKTGMVEEKHAKKTKKELDSYFTDKKSHLYTLVINSDNSFQIFVDQTLVNSGSLLNDLEPSITPPKQISDPDDKKPADWDDQPKIVDKKATKPEDWDETQPEKIIDEKAVKPKGWLDDEPLNIPDPKASKPKDWDEQMDGKWEPVKIENPKCKSAPGCGVWKPPMIANPKYKGKWSAPMIDNPNYKGVWKAKMIDNPDFFEDSKPFNGLAPISSWTFELWSMTDGIVFDNFMLSDSKQDADEFAGETWVVKKDLERKADPNAQSVVDAIREATNERPWIWIVIVLVIGLPFALIIWFCCRSSSNEDPRLTAAKAKKFDDLQQENENDDMGKENDDKESELEDEDKGASGDSPKKSKAHLEDDSSSEPDNAQVGNDKDIKKSESSDVGDEEKQSVTRRRKNRKA